MSVRRYTWVISLFCALAFPCVSARTAHGNEQIRPLAISGDWIALSHSDSMLAPPDMCLAVQRGESLSFVIRADEDDIEIRLLDTHWSLPSGVSGDIQVNIDNDTYDLTITDNTSNMVIFTISKKTLQSMIAAMNKAASMAVKPGDAAPHVVSLNGSNKVTTAFLTCAGIHAKGEGAGSDPFK